MSREVDLHVLAEGKPFIRGVLAFLVYLVKARDKAQIHDCYTAADIFIKQLEEDLACNK
jgi:hypothetical protein